MACSARKIAHRKRSTGIAVIMACSAALRSTVVGHACWQAGMTRLADAVSGIEVLAIGKIYLIARKCTPNQLLINPMICISDIINMCAMAIVALNILPIIAHFLRIMVKLIRMAVCAQTEFIRFPWRNCRPSGVGKEEISAADTRRCQVAGIGNIVSSMTCTA